MRYFFGENADRLLVVRGRRWRMTVVWRGGGTAHGVLAADDAEAAVVKRAAADLREIDAEEYNRLLGQRGEPGPTVPAAPPVGGRAPMKTGKSGRAAVTVDGDTIARGAEATRPVAEGIDDAIQLGTAAPPVAEPEAGKKRRKRT